MKRGWSGIFILGIILILLLPLIISVQEDICKPLIYKGPPEEKINFIFIPSEKISNEQDLKYSVEEFFDKSKDISFYSIYPYSEYENDFNFYYFNIYDTPSGPIKPILKEKCPELSKYLHQIIIIGDNPLEFSDIPASLHDYLTTYNQIGSEYIPSGDKKNLHTFLHEIGHSFGGLDEGYGKSFMNSVSIDYYKENYNKKAPAYNWDVEGCPKWCSGEMNTNSICYPAYTILKDCLLSPQTDTNEKADICVTSFFDTLQNEFGLMQPVECNFGNNCIDNTNCWFIGNGYFRAYARDIMFGSGSSDFSDVLQTYGPAGKHIKEVIELLLKSISQHNQTLTKLNIYNYSFYNEEKGSYIRGYINFNLKTNNDEPFILFNDEVLNNVFFIKPIINPQNEVIIQPIQREDTNGNYRVDVSIYSSSKEPVESVYLSFVSKKGEEREWKYYLDLSNLSLIYVPQNDFKKPAEDKNTQNNSSNIYLYLIVGVIVLIVIFFTILLLLKRKKEQTFSSPAHTINGVNQIF